MDNIIEKIVTAMSEQPRMVSSHAGSKDFVDRYNTRLTQDQEKQFMKWIADESKRQGRDLLLDLGDYDVRGYWLGGNTPDERGHGTDQYKKPNHPTFSNESKYHKVDGFEGGTWGENSFRPSKTNLHFRNKGQLIEYFIKREPGVTLDFTK